MAINQNTTESSFQSSANGGSESVSKLWQLLEQLQKFELPSEAEYLKICEVICTLLVADQIDQSKSGAKLNIRSMQLLAEVITKQFQQLVATDTYRDLVKHCLEKLYTDDAFADKKIPSPYITIMLALMDPEQGVAWILSKNMIDEAICKILTVFIDWLCSINFAPKLNVWIILLIEGLRAKGKLTCILNVRKDRLQKCKDRMRLPLFQLQVDPVIKSLEACGDFPSDIGRLSYAYTDPFDSGLHSGDSLLHSNARVGLVNLGNTCYMNSVVQALAMTKQFCTEVLLKQIDAPPFSEVQQLLALLIHSRRPELTPRAVLASTRPPGFAPGYQQDSSEFLSYLLDRLHEQEKKLLQGSIHHQPTQDTSSGGSGVGTGNGNGSSSSSGGSTSSITRHAPNNLCRTLVQKTFEGQLSVGCLCAVCNNTNHTIETFRSLDLAFPEDGELAVTADGTHSVQKLLDYFCSSEKLVGENQYFCDRCQELRDCERSVTVTAAPQNLILTVKHFRYDQSRNLRAKLMNKIMHNENVSLAVTDADGHRRLLHYRNYAVVVHYGTNMDSGHYYTYAQDGSGSWFKFNDNYVTECTTNELTNIPSPNTPYILFYQLVTDTMGSQLGAAPGAGSTATTSTSLLGGGGGGGGSGGASYGEPTGAGGVYDSFPALNELPSRLQEFIRDDNLQYRREVQEQRDKKASKMPLLSVGGPGGNRRQSDDYDDPPPSSCNSKWITPSNNFIF